MFRDTREHTQRRSRFNASGTAVGRHLVDGKLCAPNIILPSLLTALLWLSCTRCSLGKSRPFPRMHMQPAYIQPFPPSSIFYLPYAITPTPTPTLTPTPMLLFFSIITCWLPTLWRTQFLQSYPTTSLLPSLLFYCLLFSSPTNNSLSSCQDKASRVEFSCTSSSVA